MEPDGKIMSAATPHVDLRREQRLIVQRAALSFVFCGVLLTGACILLPALISFPREVGSRIAFALRIDVVIALWVVLAVRLVSRIRFYSNEDSAGSAFGAPSPKLAVRAAFLQNTLEQAFIAIVSHLALATVSGDAALAYVTGAVVLFCIGRLCFLLTYRYGAGARAFGMVTTVLPTLGAYGWTAAIAIRDLIFA